MQSKWSSKREAEGEQTQKRGSQHDHRGRDWSHVATNQGLLMPFGVGDVWEEFSPSGNSIGLFGLHFLFFFFLLMPRVEKPLEKLNTLFLDSSEPC